MNTDSKITSNYNWAGLFSLTLRLVIGWTYFSALWRRVALSNKLDAESAGYIGEKFNHFLPNALGIQPLIEYMLLNPDVLWWNMVIFTIIEGIVGLLIMFGLFSRLMSIGVMFLAMGILLGAGWIGTTCLDEWQIGVLGVATGFTLFFTGSGPYSLDNWLMKKNFKITQKPFFSYLGSGVLPLKEAVVKRIFLIGSIAILGLTLFTNQYFHGGIWGDLHNKSVKPKLELSEANFAENQLNFEVYRVEGVDVYGSFLIGIDIVDSNGNNHFSLDGEALSKFPKNQINNRYVADIKPGKHSLIIPLGAKAEITLKDSKIEALPKGNYTIILTDISGITWEIDFSK
ncbi:MAG: TQO small subunit DoxD [Bacteroidota bacterium]